MALSWRFIFDCRSINPFGTEQGWMGRNKGGIHGTINMTTSLLCILDFLILSFFLLSRGLDWFDLGFFFLCERDVWV
jgi:hypothetical protein